MAAGPCHRPTARQVWYLAPAHEGKTMFSRAGGDTTDRENHTTNNLITQELALAGPSPIETPGREPGGPAQVEFSVHEGRPPAVRASGSALAPILREIQSGGPTSVTSRMPEPGDDAGLVDLLGPDGLRHTVRMPCGIYATGGQR